MKCITCSFSYKFFIGYLESCYPICQAGEYEKLNQEYPLPSQCDDCQDPCKSCSACDPSRDSNCDANDPDAGAKFCTECSQDGYFPKNFLDIEDVPSFVA